MLRQQFKREELPMEQLQQLGLADWNVLHIDDDDLTALLAGRRTDMLRLENLEQQGLHIPALDAKLSLRRNDDGKVELLAHPIYKFAEGPEYLTDTEKEALEKGEAVNVLKTLTDGEGDKREVLVEFDKETNEFIEVDTGKIFPPEEINGVPLTKEQKKNYRKGKEVETEDGTTIQYSAQDKHAIRANKLALIASVLIDGGVSYVLFKGLNALFNKKQEAAPGKNFQQALEKMRAAEARQAAPAVKAEPGEDEEQAETISR
ncbi:DUF4099 domain-containing protein [Mucilaginibacter corticis]|uniref:DUF4099 domain-containing protein n=1 Tax=Mucilaginibacter corticis TaxID=2597670 RepID=A0A556MWV3_9SPHI|nr:DUF4099 domain-containing protein [Mucilaginibacter corticis]TSJ44401.1 DUF4099 domain-containing protein [Mucilaginibacter corticis]